MNHMIMTKRLSFAICLLSLCCYDFASSFTTKGHAFIQSKSRKAHPVHSILSIIKEPLISPTPSRHGLFLASSDVDESDCKSNDKNNFDNSDGNVTSDITKEKNSKIGVEPENDNDTKIEGVNRDNIVSFSEDTLGAFDPKKKIPLKREVLVGDPQLRVKKEEKSVAEILTELAAIQKQGPQKYCILGSRHVSYLHQQIIELLSYALVLSENHVYTSGAMGTNAAAVRGALRAGRPDLLTVILPQSLYKQTDESQELLREVTNLITMPQNDDMSLDVASRLCNSKLLSETDQLVAFAFHESTTVIEATKEAKKLEMLVTTLFLD